MNIAVYNHQHMRGACSGCYRHYVEELYKDGNKCADKAKEIYGADSKIFNYTDLGDYPSDNLHRQGFERMIEHIKTGKIDAVVTMTLTKISTDIRLVLQTYKLLKEHNVELVTVADGKDVMKVLDKAMQTL